MLKQALTPGLVQMVSILAMNKLELQEAISQELLENPLLEEAQEDVPTLEELNAAEQELRREAPSDEAILAATAPSDSLAGTAEVAEAGAEVEHAPAGEGDTSPAEEPAADPFEEIDFGSFFDDYLDPGYRINEGEEIERPSFENFLSSPTTLTDHLRWQLGLTDAGEELREAAEAVIGNLDEDGYLTAEDEHGRRPLRVEEIALSEQLPESLMREALSLVQTFDPPGVAARDLRECLLIQLFQKPTVPILAVTLVSEHLTQLQTPPFKDLARTLGVSQETINEALQEIRHLDPYPGRRYSPSTSRVIEPDVAFVKGHSERCSICGRDDCPNEYRVAMNDDGLPQLGINQQYRAMRWDRGQRDVARYIRDRYASAIQFLKNLEQRKQTIARVCHSIVARQADFLNHGIDHLKPMMIKDVAEEIGVHPSTVSRAVANKYVHTSQGVFELRYFFTESVQGARGQETSLLILKRRVKKLIEEEDPRHPLTDERITEILRGQGIDVTRRTIAKYREDMNIPSTHRRRRKE
jgi:RNA polymerase sigma-54 factor